MSEPREWYLIVDRYGGKGWRGPWVVFDSKIRVVEYSALAEARTQIDEQCRINAMGQERELRLMAIVKEQEKEIARLKETPEFIREMIRNKCYCRRNWMCHPCEWLHKRDSVTCEPSKKF